MTQEQVAERLSVTRQAVTKWESGQSAPSTENLFRLAALFETTVDFLLTEKEAPAASYPSVPAEAEIPPVTSGKTQRPLQKNFRFALLLGFCFYGFFLLYKLFRCEIGFDRGLLFFLFNYDFRTLPYPFSWLLHNRVYLICAAISVMSALFGGKWFAYTSASTCLLGILVSEPIGYLFEYVNDVGVTVNHSWAIWFLCYLGGILLGILREVLVFIHNRLQKTKKTPD
jgi:transcriptional regulator with XRE-family HTH domain